MDVTVRTRNSIASAARKILMPDTLFHYSHAPLKKWFIVQYLFFVSWGIIRNGNIITDCFILHMLQICYNCYGENR